MRDFIVTYIPSGEVNPWKFKALIKARGLEHALNIFYNLIGKEEFYNQNCISALFATVETKIGPFKIKREKWIWSNGQIL